MGALKVSVPPPAHSRTITGTAAGWLWFSLSFESLPNLGFTTLLKKEEEGTCCREAHSSELNSTAP